MWQVLAFGATSPKIFSEEYFRKGKARCQRLTAARVTNMLSMIQLVTPTELAELSIYVIW